MNRYLALLTAREGVGEKLLARCAAQFSELADGIPHVPRQFSQSAEIHFMHRRLRLPGTSRAGKRTRSPVAAPIRVGAPLRAALAWCRCQPLADTSRSSRSLDRFGEASTWPSARGAGGGYPRPDPQRRATGPGGCSPNLARASTGSSGFPGTVAHAGNAFEVRVLSPERSTVEPGGGEDHAIGHGEPGIEAEACGGHGESSIEIDDRALLHDGHGAQRVALVALLEHALEHLVDRQRGDHQLVGLLDGRGEEGGVRAIGEVLEPRARVHDVHARSGSRGTAVSMPLRNPRMCFAGSSGMSSMRFAYRTACTFCPGDRRRLFRMLFGMTTWNLGEIVSVSTAAPLIDRGFVCRHHIDGIPVCQPERRKGRDALAQAPWPATVARDLTTGIPLAPAEGGSSGVRVGSTFPLTASSEGTRRVSAAASGCRPSGPRDAGAGRRGTPTAKLHRLSFNRRPARSPGGSESRV